jgi:hypothetical protein
MLPPPQPVPVNAQEVLPPPPQGPQSGHAGIQGAQGTLDVVSESQGEQVVDAVGTYPTLNHAVSAAAHVSDASSVDQNESQEERYAKRNRRPVSQPYDANLLVAADCKPPMTYAEAKARFEWPLWPLAVNDELCSLWEGNVHKKVSVESLPEEKQVIPTKWCLTTRETQTVLSLGSKHASCAGVSIRLKVLTTMKHHRLPLWMQR